MLYLFKDLPLLVITVLVHNFALCFRELIIILSEHYVKYLCVFALLMVQRKQVQFIGLVNIL